MELDNKYSRMRPSINLSKRNCIEVEKENYLDYLHSCILESITSHSQGHLRKMALKHFEKRGKMLRPLFIMKLAESLDLPIEKTIPWAAACELLHNATLIHDDLQDGDEYRRGVPTTWKLFGSEQAINAGDYLLVIAPSFLYSLTSTNIQLLNLYTSMSSRIVCGQVNEFEFNKFKKVENSYIANYLECISGKTSTLFSGLALGVGYLSNSNERVLDSLEEIFFSLGHLFQMQDDILDLYGDKERLEKGCDIKEGKFSFLVAKHLDSYPEDFEFVKVILLKERKETSSKDVKLLTDLFVERGTLNSCIGEIHSRVNEILSNPYLGENIGLRSLTQTMILKILKPIEHLEVKSC
jgi:geranylgeranyl diphosphate synthase type I